MGQADNTASGVRARAPQPRRGRRKAHYPDKIGVACPAGTRDRIEEAAAFDRLSPAEWMRQALRLALDAARKRMARTGGK